MKNSLLLYFLCALSNFAWCQTFQNLYGGSLNDDFSSIVQIPNGDYIVSGTTNSAAVGGANIYIARININGVVVWETIYGGAGEDVSYTSVLNANGNIVVASASSSFNGGNDLDILLFEIDLLGRIIWSRTYGNRGLDEIPRKINISPAGLVLCSTIGSPGDISPDFYVFEVNNNGSRVIWENRIGIQNGYGDIACSIIPSRTGGFILVGGSYTTNTLYNQVVIRLSNTGVVQSNISFGGMGNENAQDVIELSNNDIVVMGNFRLLSGAGLEYSLTKIRPNNTIDWINTYGDRGVGDQRAYGFRLINGGNFAISGYTNTLGNGGNDILVVRADQNGRLLNSAVFGSSNNETSSCLVVNSDNSLTITGTSNSPNGRGLNDGFLIKTNVQGMIPSPCSISNVLQNNLALATSINNYTQTRSILTPLLVNILTRAMTMTFNSIACAALPVNLLYFKCEKQSKTSVVLKWATSQEINNDFYLIERSSDAVNWEDLKVVKGGNNSNSYIEYSYLDNLISVNEKEVFYRLKQFDNNGDFRYHEIVNCCLNCSELKDMIQIYPIPIDDKITVKINNNLNADFDYKIFIHDLVGGVLYDKVIANSSINQNGLEISLNDFRSGVYFLTVINGDVFEKVKIYKK